MSKAQVANNPVAAILCKVAGFDVTRKRGRTAKQMWMKERFPSVKKEFDEDFGETGKDARRGRINEVANFATDIFEELPASEQAHWKKLAEQDVAAVAAAKVTAQEPLQMLRPEDTQA